MLLKRQQAALNGTNACRRNIAVVGGELAGVFTDPCEQCAQVLQIEQQQTIVIGNLECECQHACLGVVQIENAREQYRPHFRNRRPHRVTLRAEHIPQRYRAGRGCVWQLQQFYPFLNLGVGLARLRNTGEVTFDVGHEYRYTNG